MSAPFLSPVAAQGALFRTAGDHVLTLHPRYRSAHGDLARASGSCACGSWISRRYDTADGVSTEYAAHVRQCAP